MATLLIDTINRENLLIYKGNLEFTVKLSLNPETRLPLVTCFSDLINLPTCPLLQAQRVWSTKATRGTMSASLVTTVNDQ